MVLVTVVERQFLQEGKDICKVLSALHPLFHTEGLVGMVWGLSSRAGVRRIPERGVLLPPEKWEEGVSSSGGGYGGG